METEVISLKSRERWEPSPQTDAGVHGRRKRAPCFWTSCFASRLGLQQCLCAALQSTWDTAGSRQTVSIKRYSAFFLFPSASLFFSTQENLFSGSLYQILLSCGVVQVGRRQYCLWASPRLRGWCAAQRTAPLLLSRETSTATVPVLSSVSVPLLLKGCSFSSSQICTGVLREACGISEGWNQKNYLGLKRLL